MLGELTEKGDKVFLVNLSSPEGTYDPGYPEGTICTIIGYPLIKRGEDPYHQSKGIKLGYYENRCWATLKMPDGKIKDFGFWYLAMYDTHLYGERFIKHREFQNTDKDWFWYNMIFAGEIA